MDCTDGFHVPIWFMTSSKIAANLLNADTGDIEFVARDVTNSYRKLYAHKDVLSANSEYFAARRSHLK